MSEVTVTQAALRRVPWVRVDTRGRPDLLVQVALLKRRVAAALTELGVTVEEVAFTGHGLTTWSPG